MTPALSPDVYQDDIALALARVMTVANKRARIGRGCGGQFD